MRKTMKGALTVILVFVLLHGNSQQPVLSVQSFEYVWQKDVTGSSAKGVIDIASGDSAKQSIEKSFALAIQQRWNMEVPQMSMSVKPLSLFSFTVTPKFNTKLKNPQPGIWYMFLQIFDRGNNTLYYNEDNALSTTLELKCRIINGSGDSVLLDRSLSVKLFREPAPPDQVRLKRLPAYPVYFIKAFDSIATLLFQHEPVYEKDIWLRSACVFTESKTVQQPVSQLVFKSDDSHYLASSQFSFHMPGPTYTKTKSRKNTGGNIATGAITLFTGLNLNKSREFEYKADFPFEDSAGIYHCIVNYFEEESAEREREKKADENGSKSYSVESGSYTLNARHADSGNVNVITLGNDTLVTFGLTYITKANERNSYTHLWDGSDSATIMPLPNEWNNRDEDDNIILSGKMAGNPFLMKTLKENTIKEFYINGQLVITMHGKPLPAKALLYQPLSEQQIKLFVILSSLPYSYFNNTAN